MVSSASTEEDREETSWAPSNLYELHKNERAIEEYEKIITKERARVKQVFSWFLFSVVCLVILTSNSFLVGYDLRLWLGAASMGLACVSLGLLSWFFYSRFNLNLPEWRSEINDARMRKQELRIRMIRDEREDIFLWNYHMQIAGSISSYRESADRYRGIHNAFQTFSIAASTATTVLITASAAVPYFNILAALISFGVAFATGFTGYFKFRERSMSLKRAADDLEYELNSVELGINSYSSGESKSDSLRVFAQKAESIKLEQKKREQQLDQPSAGKSSAAPNE